MKNWTYFSLALLACLQWMTQLHLGIHPAQPWTALSPGLCIFGASFLLSWAAEASEMDLPQNISIGIIALIAVLPEYAVDVYFAWTAGKQPAYTAYATANMTGANRLLIGLGWPAVLLACWYRRGTTEIRLAAKNSIELVTLLAATLYSFLLPLKATLSFIDSIILLCLFIFYGYLSSKSSMEEPELEGPALMIAALPKLQRRMTILIILLFSAAGIYLSAKPFAEGILAIGRHFKIEEFLLVQWLAPVASEAPEFIVATVFALKGRPDVGLRTLVASKVNQWTLLVGMLPLAYNLSGGHWAAMPLDARQIEEIFLTSAQSLLGLVILLDLRFSFKEALLLMILFFSQIAFPETAFRYTFAGMYIGLALSILILQGARRGRIYGLVAGVFKS